MANFDGKKCPKCGSLHTKWHDEIVDADVFQELRECLDCGCRYGNQYTLVPDKQFIDE